MNDNFAKYLVMVLRKLGIVEILITQADSDAIKAIEDKDQRPTLLMFQSDEGTHLRIMTVAEANELQAEQTANAPRIQVLN